MKCGRENCFRSYSLQEIVLSFALNSIVYLLCNFFRILCPSVGTFVMRLAFLPFRFKYVSRIIVSLKYYGIITPVSQYKQNAFAIRSKRDHNVITK
jgi:hypothetical protein